MKFYTVIFFVGCMSQLEGMEKSSQTFVHSTLAHQQYKTCEKQCFEDVKKFPDESCLVKALSGFNPKVHECYFRFRACMKRCLIEYKHDLTQTIENKK